MIHDGLNTEDTSIRSFLMIGQSNMAGRGEFNEVAPIENPDCYMLRMGRWQAMREPINPDRPIFEGKFHSGIGLAASFADEAQKELGCRIGLIPCADGGTRIDQWMPGEILYDHAVMMAKLAMRTSVLSGILWHQGESDCGSEEALLSHKQKFITMITALRKELGNEALPVLIGELAETYTPAYCLEDRPQRMNRQYLEIEELLPKCCVISAKGLTMKPDGIHFDSASLRLFGKRYFDGYRIL